MQRCSGHATTFQRWTKYEQPAGCKRLSQLQLRFGMCKICPKKTRRRGAGRAGGAGRTRQSIARVKALFKLCAAAWKRAFLAAWLMMIPDNRHLKDIYAATGVVFMLPVAAAAEPEAGSHSNWLRQTNAKRNCQVYFDQLGPTRSWWWSSPLLLIIIIIKIIFIFSGAATPAATH